MEVPPDRVGGVDRDGKLDSVGRADLVDLNSDRAGGMDRDGEFVTVDSDGAEVEEGASFVLERLRVGSFQTEDGCSDTSWASKLAGVEKWIKEIWNYPDAN